jgi:ribosomal protein L37AE/L43A
MKISPEVVWFLHPDTEYENRKLYITHCPVCQKLVVRYVRQGIMTGKYLSDTFTKGKAESLLESLRKEREYTSFDLIKKKGIYGFRYGETIEKKVKGGKKVIIQKSVDFNGNKEVVKQVYC